MTTKKLVPRASGEGAMGVTDNAWGEAYYDTGNFNKGLFVKGSGIEDVIANTVTQGGLGGEWTRNGLDIYYNGGNVGIGVSNPSEPLRVSSVGPDGRIMGFANSGGAKLNARLMSHDNGSNYVDTKISFDMVSTDGTAHEPALTLKAGGNVGIGTTNPGVKLHLAGDASSIIRLENTDLAIPTDRIIGGLEFEKKDPSGAGAGVVGGLRMHSADLHGQSTYLALSTTSIASLDQEAMRIDSNGNVGIGTPDPATSLDINKGIGEASPIITLSRGGVGKSRFAIANATDSILDGALTDDLCIRTEGGNIRFGTASATKTDMSILSSGNVGIGTTSPTNALSVIRSSTLGVPAAWIHNSNNSAAGNFGTVVSCISNLPATNVFQVRSNNSTHTNGNGLLTVKGDGKVGIGTTSPECPLMIKADPSNDSMFKMLDERAYVANENRAGISFQGLDSGGNRTAFCGISAYGASGGRGGLRFSSRSSANATTTGIVLNEEGKVGIGTTSPSTALEVNGESGSQLRISRDSNSSTQYSEISGGGSIMKFLSVSSTPVNEAHSIFTFVSDDGTDELERMRIDANGNVGIGVTSLSAKLHIQGDDDELHIPGSRLQTNEATLFTYNISETVGSYSQLVLGNRQSNSAMSRIVSQTTGAGTSDLVFSLTNGSDQGERMRIGASGGVKVNILSNSSDVSTDANGYFTTASDKRLKNDLGDCEYGLNEVLQVQPKRYTWKDGPEDANPTVGFFAQDVHDVMPEAAPREAIQNEKGEDDYKWGFHSQTIIAALVNATKEQQTIIEDLKSRIETLENK